MSRVEENEQVVDKMIELAESMPNGSYEEMMSFQMSAISSMLADISRSFAIIADKIESEDHK